MDFLDHVRCLVPTYLHISPDPTLQVSADPSRPGVTKSDGAASPSHASSASASIPRSKSTPATPDRSESPSVQKTKSPSKTDDDEGDTAFTFSNSAAQSGTKSIFSMSSADISTGKNSARR